MEVYSSSVEDQLIDGLSYYLLVQVILQNENLYLSFLQEVIFIQLLVELKL